MSIDAHQRDRPRAERREPLDPLGRATRFSCALETGTPAELWCLAKSDLGIVKRLVVLGLSGIGGFDVGFGEDDDGAFVLRRISVRTLDGLAKGERLEGLTALSKVRDLARALAACEKGAIFPGPMRPVDVVLSTLGRTEAWLAAEGYIRALVGDASVANSTSSGPSPRWTPPEQADGAPWDNAANRYVLGLVAYRILSGVHPFSGIGLRDAMRAQGSPPPPFDDDVARALRPGTQSLVLAMLDPDPSKRPRTAAEIVTRCEEIVREGEPAKAIARPEARRLSPAAVPVPVPALVPAGTPNGTAPWKRLLLTAAPIAFGLVVATIGLASSTGTSPPPTAATPVSIAPQKPLERTTAEACASCHARQVTEWQRSVMAHAVKSPLFGALESVVEEQVGRDARCPNGAGVLRKASGDTCRDDKTGITVTGAGGEHWCVNCHAAGDNLATTMPAWSAQSFGSGGGARKPLKDLLPSAAMEGISCAVCHQTIGPVHASGAARPGEYEGNATWTSFATGAVFRMRPEDGVGVSGIGNSGYRLDTTSFVSKTLGAGGPGDPIVHRRAPPEAKAYLASSEFCGACHDVRLFGTDSIGVREKGEHFKRLRNAYSEWKTWADTEKVAGRRAATCQDCHMSLYPGVCVAGAGAGSASGSDGCPTGFHFESRAPGEKARGMVASSSSEPRSITSHYFTSVDLPLSTEFDDRWASDATLDVSGSPVGLELRRRQLLTHTFKFALGRGARVGGQLDIPVEVENTGAGHRVPAGFSQEREFWVELSVKDARGAVVYEVGRISDDDADLRDKAFVRVTTRDDNFDLKGKPQGVFGADVVDGPDVPRWSPNPQVGGTTFRGKGLINFQNGFLRCVKCIGFIDRDGKCQPGAGQGRTRADRFDDGAYDIDTGECRSNLSGSNAFFETYFPVGALDADRGATKAPDAILDTRSVPPGAQLRYTYEVETAGHPGPFVVRAKLRFRPFPPFLLRAFADYEARKASAGLRPSGAQLTTSMLRRNHPIDLAEASATIE